MSHEEDALDQILSVPDVVAITGLRRLSVYDAIRRGRIAPSRLIGPPGRGTWITTRDAVARFQARKDARRKPR